jgi:hypothetical protein
MSINAMLSEKVFYLKLNVKQFSALVLPLSILKKIRKKVKRTVSIRSQKVFLYSFLCVYQMQWCEEKTLKYITFFFSSGEQSNNKKKGKE